MSHIFDSEVPFPNALMFLMSEDERLVEIPEIDGVANFWRTNTVLAQAVQHDIDGPIRLQIATTAPRELNMRPLYEGLMHSDRRALEIRNVYLERIFRFRTWSHDVKVSIWGDDPRQPERVLVQCPDIAGEIGHIG